MTVDSVKLFGQGSFYPEQEPLANRNQPEGEEGNQPFQNIFNKSESDSLLKCQLALVDLSIKYERELDSHHPIIRFLHRLNPFDSSLKTAYKQARGEVMEEARRLTNGASVNDLAALYANRKLIPEKASFSKDVVRDLLYYVSLGKEKDKDATAENSYLALRAISRLYYKEMKSHHLLVRLFMKYNPSSSSFRNVYKRAHTELVEIAAKNFGKNHLFYQEKLNQKGSIRPLTRIEKILLCVGKNAARNKKPVGFGWEVRDSAGVCKAYLIGTIHCSTVHMNKTPLIEQAISKGDVFYGELNGEEIKKIHLETNDLSRQLREGVNLLQFTSFRYFMDYEIIRQVQAKKGNPPSIQGLETLKIYKGIEQYEKARQKTSVHQIAIEEAANKIGNLKVLPAFLRVFLKRHHVKKTYLDVALFDLWQRGNAEQMASLLASNEEPGSRQPYLIDRNVQWWNGSENTPTAGGLKEVFDKKDGPVATIFAGTAHFFGEGSLIEYMERDGYVVQPMRVTLLGINA